MTPRLSRRRFVQASALAGATALSPLSPLLPGRAAWAASDAPRTGFEASGGAAWTTHAEELAFLEDVARRRSDRVHVEVIGRTFEDRPIHLVTLGAPVVANAPALTVPTTLVVGSQHGNEPAGREAALQLLRDLAFTEDAALVRQLGEQAIQFVPSANPDGRAANTRRNRQPHDGTLHTDDRRSIDINRDHLNLVSLEAQAIHRAFSAWLPDLVLDLHEYGPGTPLLYDDDLLFLWPRNLNADAAVRLNAKSFCFEYLKRDAEAAGYTADVYGVDKVGPNVGPVAVPVDQEVQQTAGDGDEGISRNALGLRHSLGILVESAVSRSAFNDPGELSSNASVQLRRVASHVVASHAGLRYLREQGDAVKAITDGAPLRKAREGRDRTAPVYFGGADNEAPTAAQVQDPPPVAYRLTAEQASALAPVLALHGVDVEVDPAGGVRVPLAQHAEPVIPLLLDARGRRNAVEGEPVG